MTRRALSWVLAFAVLFAFYFSVGRALARATRVFETEWLSIDADKVAHVIGDPSYVPSRHRQLAHPLFDVFCQPLGVPLSRIFGFETVALAATAGAAALGILGFRLMLLLAGIQEPYASTFSLLLSISTAHILYGSLPETFIFSFASLTLAPLAYLGVRSDRRFVGALALAAFVSGGITVTNVVLSILFFGARFWRRPPGDVARHAVGFGAASGVLWGAGLALKRLLHPAMQPLFGADMISSHAAWIDLGLLKHPVSCLAEQLPYFFVYNVVAPDIVPNPGNPWDKYGLAGSIPTTWILAVALYVPLVLGAAYALWKTQRFKSHLFVTLALFLGFSIVLHLFYGASEPHLHAAHYTFAWVAMLACAFSADGAARRLPAGVSALLVAVLAATCALVAVNNLSFLYRIYVAHP